jgi:hypothetical protein
MAIRKTGSRRIIVDGVAYLWRVRPRPTYSQANAWGPLSVCVQLAKNPGSVLVVNLTVPRPDNWLHSTSTRVTPGKMESLIRSGLAAGWHPERAGRQFALTDTPPGCFEI